MSQPRTSTVHETQATPHHVTVQEHGTTPDASQATVHETRVDPEHHAVVEKPLHKTHHRKHSRWTWCLYLLAALLILALLIGIIVLGMKLAHQRRLNKACLEDLKRMKGLVKDNRIIYKVSCLSHWDLKLLTIARSNGLPTTLLLFLLVSKQLVSYFIHPHFSYSA